MRFSISQQYFNPVEMLPPIVCVWFYQTQEELSHLNFNSSVTEKPDSTSISTCAGNELSFQNKSGQFWLFMITFAPIFFSVLLSPPPSQK